MSWPQIVWIFLAFFGLLISFARNGQTTQVSFGWTAINTVLVAMLLWAGGFFE